MVSSGEIRMPERYYGSEIAEFLVPGDICFADAITIGKLRPAG